MSRQTGPSPGVGAFGISLGSTVPQNETQGSHFLQTLRDLENQVNVRQAEIDTLKEKLVSLEADVFIKKKSRKRTHQDTRRKPSSEDTCFGWRKVEGSSK